DGAGREGLCETVSEAGQSVRLCNHQDRPPAGLAGGKGRQGPPVAGEGRAARTALRLDVFDNSVWDAAVEGRQLNHQRPRAAGALRRSEGPKASNCADLSRVLRLARFAFVRFVAKGLRSAG